MSIACMPPPDTHGMGFTLIELSIVLVIIGLIVGGVLVGQDLVRAAGVRATVSQIEKYNTAANTFKDKYGGLPGDISNATQFGFIARGSYAGQGDGNGILEGNYGNAAGDNGGFYQGCGETSVFWVDLAAAHLIDGTFNTATSICTGWGMPTATTITLFMPPAKLGGSNYILVASVGTSGSDGNNYFQILSVTYISGATPDFWSSLTVQQAYAIDNKTDDGLPQSGRVMANVGHVWMAAGEYGGAGGANPGTTATGSSTTCYDNNGSTSNPMRYSVEISNGANVNCALSFRFQ